MKKSFILLLFTTMSFFGYSQDWFGLNRYQADNKRIIESGNWPEVVFMGNSITDNWAYFHPNFFSSNNFCGRGIGGQTSAQMLVRFTADVINLHPKAVVIMAGTNDVAHNDYWVSPEKVVDNIVAMVDMAQANGIVPIISSIPPCNVFFWSEKIEDAGKTIVGINKNLKAYAEANDIVFSVLLPVAKKDIDLLVVCFTSIPDDGTIFFSAGEKADVLQQAFPDEAGKLSVHKGIFSRKKQILPRLTEVLESM